MGSENEHQRTESEFVSDENIATRSKTETGGIIAYQDHWEAFSICNQQSLVITFMSDFINSPGLWYMMIMFFEVGNKI